MGSFKERLQELIGERSAACFARHCGLPATNIRSYLQDREPGLENLIKIAEKTGVMLDWLMLGRGIKYRADAATVDVVELMRGFLEGPMTPDRFFEMMVTHVSLIQDPEVRKKEMMALVSKRKELDKTAKPNAASRKKKQG
jgi:hypothetical protein